MLTIVPAQPRLRASPPAGDGWIHEVKFDGWRIQIHKFLDTVALYTKGGHHVERRFKSLVDAIARLPIRLFIIDGEVTACDKQGRPDFRALHFSVTTAAKRCAYGHLIYCIRTTRIYAVFPW